MTIGKVASILGLCPDTIRDYERRGLIPPAKRSPTTGWRIWDDQEVLTLWHMIHGSSYTSKETDRLGINPAEVADFVNELFVREIPTREYLAYTQEKWPAITSFTFATIIQAMVMDRLYNCIVPTAGV